MENKIESLNVKLGFSLSIFLVMNQEGQFFRAKGYGGSGNSWVPDPKKARIYPKIGPARTCVTFFTKNYPAFGTPQIVEFSITEGRILNEDERVKKAISKISKKEAKDEERRAKYRKERAQADLERAQKILNDLS